MIKSFEEILAWQKSKELSKSLYQIFKDSNDFGFRDQIQRASVSIMNNIAEGFERNSKNEFKYFLNISKGSCGEVRSMLILAKELNKIDELKYKELYAETLVISKLISALMKTL